MSPSEPARPKLRMYILVREAVPAGFAVVAAAHASLAAYLAFRDTLRSPSGSQGRSTRRCAA
ncbi:unnamed protein product [Gemmataceae bacterium]|nr:unnamed protein product [Gemmataceae bacterium]VTU00204.1 unnamed protein product [Gemmataceae bacterium]